MTALALPPRGVAALGRGRVDPPAGVRCRHDMLAGQCSWCGGVCDLPASVMDASRRVIVEDGPSIELRWFPAEVRGNCARCSLPIRLGELVAWSEAEGGAVGRCCEDEA